MFDNLGTTVLWWSSGIDSTLLLALMREAKIKFDIIHLREFWTKEQLKRADRFIKEWNLQTFSYPPQSVSFIGKDDELTTVFEYAVQGGTIPMLRDVTEGTRCIADLQGMTTDHMPFQWDTHVVGSRKGDTHWSLGGIIPAKRWVTGTTQFYAPLYDWSREEVLAMSKQYGLDTSREMDEGDISLCTNCIKGTGKVYCPETQTEIDSVVWDGNANLEAFRNAYG